MNTIDYANMCNLGITKAGENVSYGYTSTNTEYRPAIKYTSPDVLVYKDRKFKVDSITEDREGHLTIEAYKHPYYYGFSGTLTIDDPTLVKKLKEAFNPYSIKKVIVNPKKNATTVLWADGTHTVVKRSEGDEPADIWSVVSYALAEKVYGSNSAFKREIKGKVERMKE